MLPNESPCYTTPGELRECLAGNTGHSQGIVSTVAIAVSTTLESFTENTRKAFKWLFFCGLRGQQAFPVVSLNPNMIQGSIDGGEGTPSPMLSVTGLVLKNLEPHMKKTNIHLPEHSELHVSLHNCCYWSIAGPIWARHGAEESPRTDLSGQSQTPFSQGKLVFSMRFLVVGVPYHNREYLEGQTEKVFTEDFGRRGLLESRRLAYPCL